MLPAQGPCRKELESRLDQMMRQHGDSVKRLCCLYLGDMALAEDAAQETFIKAWRALPGYRGESSERTWLTHIAVNTCRDFLRTGWLRRMDRRVTPEELPLSSPAPDVPPLAEALSKLARHDREVLVLRYYEQLSPSEISQLLKLPLPTVKSRISRAKKKLQQLLEGWDIDD